MASRAARGATPTQPGRFRPRLLTAVLLAPAGHWYVVLLVLPLAIVVIFSFGTRAKNGGYAPAFVLDNYARAFSKPEPFLDSLWMAAAATIGCLLVGLPLAYFIATRASRRKGLLILLLVVPFWTSFLIRTYAWLLILGPGVGVGTFLGSLVGQGRVDLLGTPLAVLIGSCMATCR